MSSIAGGRFVFGLPGSSTLSGVNLGLTDGVNGPGTAVTGAFNIEVFTSVAGGNLPALATGYQAGLIDNGAGIANNFLTGTTLQLFSGDYMVNDSVTGSAQQTSASIVLGSGNQTA